MLPVNMAHRYTNIQLPAFKYIPKQGPHPSQIKDVIHIPELECNLSDFSVNNWSNSSCYLYAIDLFNLGYFWEVHEVLEKLWIELGKNSDEGIFIQGLIQISVALLKYSQGNFVGVKRLSEKAIPRIISQKGIYLGIDIQEIVEQCNSFLKDGQETFPQIFLNFE